MPTDLKALYGLHDGQRPAQAAAPGSCWAPMFGVHRFLPLDDAIAEWSDWKTMLANETNTAEAYCSEVRDGDPMRGLYWEDTRFPFAADGQGNLYSVDLSPPKGGKRGQVLSHGADVAVMSVVAPSVTDLMASAAAKLDPGEEHRYEISSSNETGSKSRIRIFFDMDWRAAPPDPGKPPPSNDDHARSQHEEARYRDWLATRGLSEPEQRGALGVLQYTAKWVVTALNERWAPTCRDADRPWTDEGPDAYVEDVHRTLRYRSTIEIDRGTVRERVGRRRIFNRRALTLLHRYQHERGAWTREQLDRANVLLADDPETRHSLSRPK